MALRTKKPKKKKSSTPTATSLRNAADRLAREYCKRGQSCEAEGFLLAKGRIACSGWLEWAHLKSRGPAYYAIRHHPANCVCLCSFHHRYFHANPDEFGRFVEQVHPGRWDKLNDLIRQRAESPCPTPLKEVYQEWIRYYKEKHNG